MLIEVGFDLTNEILQRHSADKPFFKEEDLRKYFFEIFMKEESKRGCSLLDTLKEVDDDFRMSYNEKILLMGDEEPYNPNDDASFLGDVEFSATKPELSSDEEEYVGYSAGFNPFADILNGSYSEGIVSNVSTEEPEEDEEADSGSASDFLSMLSSITSGDAYNDVGHGEKERKRVTVKRSEGAPKVNSPVTKAKRTVISNPNTERAVKNKSYATLVDFIKENPNCSVKDATKYFSEREISKQIKQGKVFMRRGKLSI